MRVSACKTLPRTLVPYARCWQPWRGIDIVIHTLYASLSHDGSFRNAAYQNASIIQTAVPYLLFCRAIIHLLLLPALHFLFVKSVMDSFNSALKCFMKRFTSVPPGSTNPSALPCFSYFDIGTYGLSSSLPSPLDPSHAVSRGLSYVESGHRDGRLDLRGVALLARPGFVSTAQAVVRDWGRRKRGERHLEDLQPHGYGWIPRIG